VAGLEQYHNELTDDQTIGDSDDEENTSDSADVVSSIEEFLSRVKFVLNLFTCIVILIECNNGRISTSPNEQT
jgi:hypothetical protein